MVRPDGVQVASTPANFMAGTLMAPVSLNESGAVAGNYVWIGTSASPTSHGKLERELQRLVDRVERGKTVHQTTHTAETPTPSAVSMSPPATTTTAQR